MVWRTETECLMRIVALLLSLAAMAEQAAGRSRRVRRDVLSIVRPAEAVARQYLLGAASDQPVSPHDWPAIEEPVSAFDTKDSEAAHHLAARLRVLAFALVFLLMRAAPTASGHRVESDDGARHIGDAPIPAISAEAFWRTLKPPDAT